MLPDPARHLLFLATGSYLMLTARLQTYAIYFQAHCLGVTNMSHHYNLSPCHSHILPTSTCDFCFDVEMNRWCILGESFTLSITSRKRLTWLNDGWTINSLCCVLRSQCCLASTELSSISAANCSDGNTASATSGSRSSSTYSQQLTL